MTPAELDALEAQLDDEFGGGPAVTSAELTDLIASARALESLRESAEMVRVSRAAERAAHKALGDSDSDEIGSVWLATVTGCRDADEALASAVLALFPEET